MLALLECHEEVLLGIDPGDLQPHDDVVIAHEDIGRRKERATKEQRKSRVRQPRSRSKELADHIVHPALHRRDLVPHLDHGTHPLTETPRSPIRKGRPNESALIREKDLRPQEPFDSHGG